VDRSLALIVVTLGAVVISMQTPANVALGLQIGGSLKATLVQFAIGTAVMGAVVALGGGGFGGIASDRVWWHYLGGFCAVVFVTASIFTLKPLGLTLQFAGIVTGQVIGALTIDNFGWLGVERRPLTLWPLVGLGIMLLGLTVVITTRD
jgi:transporter family-2 protein